VDRFCPPPIESVALKLRHYPIGAKVSNKLMSLEVLDRAFVFFRGLSGIKGAEVFALAGLRILLP
jgi:hypothetical protein